MQTKFLSYIILLLTIGWQVMLGFSLSGSLKVYEIKTLTIVDSNFATGNRCGCAMIQKRCISLNGEIDAKNYTGYTALKSPVLPLFNTTFTAIDEDGMGYTGIFYADGRVDIAIRSYIPEKQKNKFYGFHVLRLLRSKF